MTTDIAIAPDELQVVLNQFEAGRLEVSSPLHGIEVARLEARENGYRFHGIAGPEAFEDPDVMAWGAAIDERPLYTDLLDTLLFAGIVRYANLDEFLDRRQMLKTFKRGVRFVPDTNLFYHGFPSWSGLDGEEFLVPSLVKDEINSGLNRKYGQEELTILRRSTPKGNSSLLDEFVNQRTKRARRATHFAHTSLQGLTDKASILRCEEPLTTDREENDDRIARAVRASQSERQRVPVLLTADQNMSTLCEAEGVESFQFMLPRDDLPKSAGFPEIGRWLYALAAVWGVVKVNSVLLFSEWRGRTDQRYPVKARFLNASMANGCIRDLQLCRELRGLGIDR